MYQSAESSDFEQLRRKITADVQAKGGDHIDAAVALFSLRHEKAADFSVYFSPGITSKRKKTVVIKAGTHDNLTNPVDGLDGKTVILTTRNAKRMGMDGVAVGDSWTTETGQLQGAVPVPGANGPSSPASGSSHAPAGAVVSHDLGADGNAADAQGQDAATPQDGPGLPEDLLGEREGKKDLTIVSSVVSTALASKGRPQQQAPAKRPRYIPNARGPQSAGERGMQGR